MGSRAVRARKDFILRDLGSQHLVVPTGAATREFHGFVRLNDSGAYLWGLLGERRTEDELARALVERYGIGEGQAREDVAAFLRQVADFLDE